MPLGESFAVQKAGEAVQLAARNTAVAKSVGSNGVGL